jgi:hypothetical protein
MQMTPPPGGFPPDASIDVPVDPAKGVTVTVTLDGVPQPRVVVYFQSIWLGPSTELRTDASGSAIGPVSEMLYDVASVTVVNPFGPLDATTDELLTYNGVKVGDHILVARTSKVPPPVTFTLAAPTDSPTARRYLLHTNCGTATLNESGTQLTAQVTLQGCGQTVDMLVESLDDSGHSLSSLYDADVAVSDGASVTLTGAYQSFYNKTFSYHTEAVDRPQLEIHARLLTDKGLVYEAPEQVIPLSFMNEHPSLIVALPVIPGALAVTETVYQSGDDGLEHTVDWGPASDSYMLDLEPFHSFLEEYYSVPAFVGSSIQFVWFGDMLVTDYMRARLSVTRPGDRSWQWHFVSPPLPFGGGSQNWPNIPSDIHHYNVQDGDVMSLPEVTLVSAPGGYDAIRARALSIASPLVQLTGPTGRLVYETLLPQ